MQVRILKHEEEYIAQLIRAVAFEAPIDLEKEKEKSKEPAPEVVVPEGLPYDARGITTWAAGEDGETFGCLRILPYPVRFDGQLTLMGGVGGVSTLPQHRRKGVIRACIQAALEDMYDHDYVFSALYPFRRVFYRQFGYENCGSTQRWTIPFRALNLPDVGGKIELVLPGDDLSALNEVYNACCADWNLSVVRTEFSKWLRESNWLGDKRYVYLWRDETGEPRGFLIMKKVDRILDCSVGFGMENGLLFRDARALTALLNHARGFAADYDAIRFDVPQGLRIDSLIAESNYTKCETHYNGMARIVNVRRALEMCRTRGSGSLRIAVTDPMLEQNRGTWQVDFVPGQPNRVEKIDGPADVEMPITELSQLVLGVRNSDDLPMMPNVKVNNPDAPLEGLFFSKRCHVWNLF